MKGEIKEDTKEKIEKVIRLEKAKGFQDKAAIGGLEGFIQNNCSSPEIKRIISDYGEKEPYARREALRKIYNLLQGKESEDFTEEERERRGKPEDLSLPVEEAIGVGRKRGEKFRQLGVETIEDLLFHLPRRIEDRRKEKRIAALADGESATVTGKVREVQVIPLQGKSKLVKVAVQDRSGRLYAVWFNQPWMERQFQEGQDVSLYGEAKREYGQIQMQNPVWEPAGEEKKTGRLVPIYPATEGLDRETIDWIVKRNLDRYIGGLKNFPGPEIAEKEGFLARRQALKRAHRPKDGDDFERARKSLSFSELFLFYYGLKWEEGEKREGKSLEIEAEWLEELRALLPFDPTGDQLDALRTMKEELSSSEPMNRLLQGDVGSGKTVVAAGGIFFCRRAGVQAAFMAPTTLLARQHFRTLEKFFAETDLRFALLTGETSPGEREEILDELRSGQIDLLVGTHALLEEEVQFKELALVVIDEEQRFGVAQRGALREKGGEGVNTLVTSATPIPRTIASTLYGQFDVFRLEELPQGEKNIKTYWLSESKRDQVYGYVRPMLEEGEQAYIVYPLVEESERVDLNAATEMKERLARNQLRGFDLGLLHGRMKDEEKKEVLEKFRRGEMDALVSTTVIEVGIDLPSVNLLLIDHADRFGLTQLHQLRGRIGRGGEKAYCFAIASPETEEGRRRLKTFRDNLDGFKIVEEDLKIRGPGDLLGRAQHGFENSFRACNLLRDLDIMKAARRVAAEKRAAESEPEKEIMEEFGRKFGERLNWIKA